MKFIFYNFYSSRLHSSVKSFTIFDPYKNIALKTHLQLISKFDISLIYPRYPRITDLFHEYIPSSVPPFLPFHFLQKEGMKSTSAFLPPTKIASVHYTTSLGTSGYVAKHVTEERNVDYVTAKMADEGWGYQCSFSSRSGYARRINCALHPRRGKNPHGLSFLSPESLPPPFPHAGCHATLEKSTAASIL